MQQYTIPLKSCPLVFVKLDTDEYEFSTTRNYMEYYGKSYLKGLSFVTDYHSYFIDNIEKIKVELIDNDKSIMIQFPIPYSTKFELLQLKIVDIDEFKKLNIMILKNSDDIKEQINSLKIKADQSVNTILKKQLVVNNEIKNRISKIEEDFKMISNKLSESRKQKIKIYRMCASISDNKITNSYLYISDEHEVRICNYLKKNIKKYFHSLTDRSEYDIKNDDDTKLKVLIGSYQNNINICHIPHFIKLLADMNFKLTNNCYVRSEIYLEYVYDSKIKSAEVVHNFIYEVKESYIGNIDVVHVQSLSVIYYY
jgi:hypothetical protein